MVDMIDPTVGSEDVFVRAMMAFDADPGPVEASIGLLAAQSALISRALAGHASALEAIYSSWSAMPPSHGARHDFMYRVRIVQIGFGQLGREPLAAIWTARMEMAIREFFYDHRAAFAGIDNKTYTLAAGISGIVFLAHQAGNGHVPLLGELIDWAFGGGDVWPDTPRDRQADVLVTELLEVVGGRIWHVRRHRSRDCFCLDPASSNTRRALRRVDVNGSSGRCMQNLRWHVFASMCQ